VTSLGQRQWRHPQHGSPPYARLPLRWPDSIAINLLIAGAIGFLYIYFLLGLARLDPTNLSWLSGDPAQYYIAWELYRQDPRLHWPLTFTDRVGYPLGDSITFMDPIPLLSILLKPLSPILPAPFQYLGIAAVLAASLQFFFAARLFRLLLGCSMFGVLLPSLFFLIAPPMTIRLAGHYALANHWLLVAALYMFGLLQKTTGDNIRKLVLLCGLLAGAAVGVTPYLVFMVVVVVSMGVITAWWRQRLGWKRAAGILAVTGAACLISALVFGLIRSGGGYVGGGYREFSMNLLAPIDPGVFGGLFLRSMPLGSYRTWEGYNYLGAGIVMLGIMLVPSFSPSRVRRLKAAEVVPLAVGCLVLTALAVSTKISVGPANVVDLDPHEILTKYLGVLRGSARLFWVPYYVFLTAILASAFTLWRPKKAAVLVAVALLVQFADTIPLRRGVQVQVSQSYPLPLRSPQWSSLGKDHVNLLVFPPWQCGASDPDTPGGLDGFRIFGLLAVSQRLRTNSYYAARYSAPSLAFHCDQAVRDLMNKPLSPDSAYVVSPSIARIIGAGPTGASACHTLDGFILCSTKTDFGLGPGSTVEVGVLEVPMMYASGRIESWGDARKRGYFIGDWHNADPEGIWSKGYGILQFRLSSEQLSRYYAVSLELLVPVGAKGVQYRIQSGRREQSGIFVGSSAPRVERFELQVPLQHAPDGVERIVLITEDAARPVDIGLNGDTRIFGLGIRGMTLVP
jgi:Family of unknown function (DUF6311)